MPTHLRRYQQTNDLHFVTFSCYRRQMKLGIAFRWDVMCITDCSHRRFDT